MASALLRKCFLFEDTTCYYRDSASDLEVSGGAREDTPPSRLGLLEEPHFEAFLQCVLAFSSPMLHSAGGKESYILFLPAFLLTPFPWLPGMAVFHSAK